MKIRSSAFEENGLIPAKYTCDGANISPPLEFLSVPADAKSLVLIVDDPDVPRYLREDGLWDHWVVFNIPVSVKGVAEGEEPLGFVGRNTRGESKYGGPCPPDREHRYFFKIFALDCELDLEGGASRARVEEEMSGHILDSSELMGRYDRVRPEG